MRIEGSAYVVDISRSQALKKNEPAPQQVQGARPAARVLSFDRVELSPQVREMQKLKGEMESLPEVRLDRVALAKQQVQNGGYHVEPTLLAQKMMDAYKTR
jgi:negative regulator of flagellin synthesis FlgM